MDYSVLIGSKVTHKGGNGVQGYLLELDPDLATTYLNNIVKNNSGWHI